MHRVVTLFAACCLAAAGASAQAISGTQVQGTVQDSTGAVLPSVTVTMTFGKIHVGTTGQVGTPRILQFAAPETHRVMMAWRTQQSSGDRISGRQAQLRETL